MTDGLVLTVAVPLVGALIAVVWPRRSETIGLLTVFAASAAAVHTLVTVATEGPLEHAVGAWPWPGTCSPSSFFKV